MSEDLLAKLAEAAPELHAAMRQVQSPPEGASAAERIAAVVPLLIAADPQLSRIFDGSLIKALIDYIKEHPDQALAILAWILKMFGIVIPIPPIA